MASTILHLPTRRQLLVTGGALFAWSYLPRFARAADARDPRFITIILRGALDGLGAVPPVGDPSYAGLHGPIAMSLTGDTPALPLDGFFALHPSMTNLARLYGARQATIVHATATAYRDRSHFDGQDVLESGYAGAGRTDSGWLNRTVSVLPKGERVAARGNTRGPALGVGPSTPLILRGGAPVTGWTPSTLPAVQDDLEQRLLTLYRQQDKALATVLTESLDIEKIAQREAAGMRPAGGNLIEAMRTPARGAAKLLAADDGPRIAALAFDGWDTHANEGGATGRLAQLLAGLDAAIAEFETGLGPAWKDTVLVAITEFGRTAKVNGTTGTDHGTGTVAFLAGGALAGGKMVADWPGLRDDQLFERRDLKATTDLRAVLKGLLVDHLNIGAAQIEAVFPDSTGAKPLRGLIA
ncbi:MULTISPECIES: DUF1501 domain-containing protein [unclassified Beijerinckia]|uniref:DUF1501 domain-containing protein n=1 Tax=unclassified Beijerinckia TaxID=2638183 RepID=UPI00089CDE8A|nr:MULTISPECIES: DUF1501 domain-containing protein [unclassified Beijerinckia]MDH7798530.1 uncharacterized protein (DUF1501 family) [Beijerinckia sp. GAS462]SED23971.1 Uncharacterized conserved protein, DUF1501 family [Beijerinckia sp. 28-YEA-48]